jgi:hypothetical protein
MHEPLIDTIMSAHDKATPRKNVERQVYRAHEDVITPGILHIVECPACHRLAVLARASDMVPAFWFTREQTNVAKIADSLGSLADRLAQGDPH